MNPRVSVAVQVQMTELSEAAISDHARLIVALYDRVGAGRGPQHPFSAREIEMRLRNGQTDFEFLNGRYLGVTVCGDGLELGQFARVHGCAALDEAIAAAEGRRLIKI